MLARDYDRLRVLTPAQPPEEGIVSVPGTTALPQWGIRVTCGETPNGGFGVKPQGTLRVRSRKAGDEIRLSGGTKSIKKLMNDRKISAPERNRVPILADEAGVLWAGFFGRNLQRAEENPTHYILIDTL